MGAATYSKNPIINGAVNASTTSTATLYTAPATGYAQVQLEISVGTGTGQQLVEVTIGSAQNSGIYYWIYQNNNAGLASNFSAANPQYGGLSGTFTTIGMGVITGLIVPPGQSVYVKTSSAGSVANQFVKIVGTEFING